MACPLAANQLKNLRVLIDILKKDSDFLHHPDLVFFKKYIESLGGIIPQKKSNGEATEVPSKEEPEVEEIESEESEVELDYEGCIEPDNDPPQTMGYTTSEVSGKDIKKSDEKKRKALELFAEQKYEEAINAYTEAILLNPTSALLYAKRGQCYLQLKKPNACIRDCIRALEINPDNAVAYKFRGRAHRLLGNFLKAAEDLRNACKIDYDEQADEWLKEVTPNARKLEENQRKYERKRLEKEVKETRERINRMREEQQKRVEEMKKNSSECGEEEFGDIAVPELKIEDAFRICLEPEVFDAFKDLEIQDFIHDICEQPSKFFEHMKNPKLQALVKKVFKHAENVPYFREQIPQRLRNLSQFFEGEDEKEAKKPPPGSDMDLD